VFVPWNKAILAVEKLLSKYTVIRGMAKDDVPPFVEIEQEDLRKFRDILKQEKIILIEFYKITCPAYVRHAKEIFENLAAGREFRNVVFCRHRTSSKEEIWKLFGLWSTPTTMIFRGGKKPCVVAYYFLQDIEVHRMHIMKAIEGERQDIESRIVDLGGLKVSVPVNAY